MLGGKKNKTLNSSIAAIEEGKSDKDNRNECNTTKDFGEIMERIKNSRELDKSLGIKICDSNTYTL